MKKSLRVMVACLLAVLVLGILPQIAFAKETNLVVGKTYTFKFTKKGEEDTYYFISGGGRYKLQVTDLSGRPLSKYGELYDLGNGEYSFLADYGTGMNIIYAEYSTFSDCAGGPARYQMGARQATYFTPDYKNGKPVFTDTIDLGRHKKSKRVGIIVKGDYKGKYKLRLVGKNAPKGSSTSPSSPSSPSKKKTKLTKTNTTVTVKDATYTGKALKPTVKVEAGGKKLKASKDYTISYGNNVEVGKGTVTVKGKGSYEGSIKASFQVKPKGNVYVLVYGAAKDGKPASSNNNVRIMTAALSGLKIRGYCLKTIKSMNKRSFNKKVFNSTVSKTFASAKTNDICFLYLNTHGTIHGGLTTNDGSYYSYDDALQFLGAHIKGHIVFMPEACYSGGFIKAAKKCSAKNRITVFSAATDVKVSNQIAWWFFGGGLYTQALAKGLGNGEREIFYRLVADKNRDGKVTFQELYKYICNDGEVKKSGQGPMFYSSNKSFVVYER